MGSLTAILASGLLNYVGKRHPSSRRMTAQPGEQGEMN
jgi:hypothetical protein